MLELQTDSIAAIATPPGTGGVAVIRISGPRATQIATQLTHKKNFQPNTIIPTGIYTAAGQELDRGVVSYFKAPRSYTGEDIIELNCHGSYFLAQQILEECFKAGARLATAGEFTKRAFLAGKIDLTQVEAIADMIAAKSATATQLALKHLEGDVSQAIRAIRTEILATLAEIEACLDYPDELEEPPRKKLQQQLLGYKKTIDQLIADAHSGIAIREGIKIALVGKTNVGKSSLFNRLAKESKAIVTDVHGTTRDYLEATISLRGVTATIVDTAGIRDTQDQIEQLGIARSKEHIAAADLVLFIIDSVSGITPEDQAVIPALPKKTIWVINKTDICDKKPMGIPVDATAASISAATGTGIVDLESAILSLMDMQNIDMANHVYISSLRQKEQLIKIQILMNTCIHSIVTAGYIDLLAVDLKSAIFALGEITGDQVSEEIITHIFSNFCVGK